MAEFNKILKGHQIEYYPLANPLSLSGQSFKTSNSFIVPLRQTQSTLINAIFEKRRKFLDNTFYDVSSWTLPLAFDMDYQFVDRSNFSQDLIGKSPIDASGSLFESISSDTIALAFSWKNFATSNLLAFLHENKISVRTVSKPVSFLTSIGKQRLERGDLILPVKNVELSVDQLTSLLINKLNELSIEAIEVKSGLSTVGPDIGSPSIPQLKIVRPVMIVGDGVNSYQAGEVWHLLDQRLSQDLTMMTSDEFSKVQVSEYTHLIMVGGKYSLPEKVVDKIDEWVKEGGVLITQSGASEWLSKLGWLSSEGSKLEQEPDTKISYADRDETQSVHFIGGAIVKTKIDTTHPLGFGLSDTNLAVFKRGQFSFTEAKESFVSIARFDKKPLLAGYLSKQNQKNLAGKTAVLVQKHGQGKLIAFTDDMNFRAFWLGTSRVFVNALYFSDIIRATKKSKDKDEGKDTDGKKD
jgi:hypothetical protein